MILILGGAWQGKLTWAASHGMVGPVFDLKDGWPEAPVRCCRHLEALTRAASDHGETAQQVLKLGMYIGFTGILTFSNAKKARRALAVVPENRLVLETDCPYMAPVPMRGKRCDSTMIPYTAEAAAQVLGKDMQTVLEQTCRNGERLFGIPAAEKGAEPCV